MLIEERIRESIAVKERILHDTGIVEMIGQISELLLETLKSKGKILFCGNGGSASDSQHMAAEFIGRFQCERHPLPAGSLNENTAILTAVANDYGYDAVFARCVEGLMRAEDVLVGFSTSGDSENVYRAFLKAGEIGGSTVAFLGKSGGKIWKCADYSIVVPSNCTARIQESHIMIGHIVCEIVERSLHTEEISHCLIRGS